MICWAVVIFFSPLNQGTAVMKVGFIVFAVLLAATCVNAQLDPNMNTFTFDPWSGTAYDANCFRMYDNSLVSLDLYLVYPVNFDFEAGLERPVTNVSGFECKVTGSEGVMILGWSFPTPVINVGLRPGELIVGYGAPIPVTSGSAVLATVDLFIGDVTNFDLPEAPLARCVNEANATLFIDPIYNASFAGTVAYVDADDTSDPDAAGVPVPLHIAIYQEVPVDIDDTAWGSLKALFR